MFANIFLLIVFILSATPRIAAGLNSAPLRSFFPMNEALAKELSKKFQIPLEPGLYFTDQRTVLLDPGLLFEQSDGFQFNASYLEQDLFNEILFGSNGWRSHAVSQLVWAQNGELKIEALKEFELRARWISRTYGSKLRSELWVGRPNGEKWLLAFADGNGSIVPNRFTPIPTFVQPLPDGALLAVNDFVLAHRSFDGHFRKAWNTGTQTEEFIVASGGTKQKRRALIYFDKNAQQLVFAGRAASDIPRAAQLAERPLSQGDPVNVFHLDLATQRISRLLSDLRFPFDLTSFGIVRDRNGKKERLKWNTNAKLDGAWELLPKPDVISANPRKSIGAVELASLRNLGFPPDLQSEMRAGREVPVAYHPELASRLVSILAREKDSLALILYEDGQQPIEYIRSLFKGIELQAVQAPLSVSTVENVFHLPQNLLLGARSKGPFKEALDLLKNLCEGKNTVLFLEDFPFPGLVAPPAAGSKLVTALREWEATFGPLVADGKCRVIWTIRRKLYETLKEAAPTAFGMGTTVQIPEPGPQLRREIARMTARRLEQRYRLFLDEESFELTFAQLEKEREIPGARAVPGLYQTAFMDLFDSLSREQIQKPDTARFADLSAVQQFILQRDDKWILKTMPWHPDGQTTRGEIPMWVKDRSSNSETANAIDSDQYEIWLEKPESLVSDARFQHALFLDGQSVSVLQADHSSLKALDFAPLLYGLHPRGFYFVRVDRTGEIEKREATLAFYRISDAQVKILKAGMRSTDFDGKLSIRFVDDLAVVEREGAVLGSPDKAQAPTTYYGPEGEIK
jgi:hypothetical protein